MAGSYNDAVAVSFISQNKDGLFRATPTEYTNLGPLNGPLTPEQAALPGSEAHPVLGLAAAGIATGGIAVAGAATGAVFAGVVDAWTAYRLAQAGYSMGTALGTGAAISGTTYTASAAGGAFKAYFTKGQNVRTGFDERFSYSGLGAAMTIGGLTGMYSTAMFGWAGVPNALGNVTTLPGFVIRFNSGVFGQVAGKAAQGAVNSPNDK